MRKLEIPLTGYGQMMVAALRSARITPAAREELAGRWFETPDEAATRYEEEKKT